MWVGQHFGFWEGIVEPNTKAQHSSMTYILSVSKDVVFREMEGEAVLLNLGTGIYFGLNETGTKVWNLIVQHSSLQKVFESMALDYDVPSASLEKDILQLVDQLCENKLLCRT